MKFDLEKCAKVKGMLKKKEHVEDSEEEIIKEVNPSDQNTMNTSESKKILE